MNRREKGRKAEELVCSYLKGLGCRILKRNLYTPYGEIDIVAICGNEVVFVEVRSTDVNWDVERSLNRMKLEHFLKSGLFYISENSEIDNYRFDVVIVKGNKVHEHIKGISFDTDEWF